MMDGGFGINKNICILRSHFYGNGGISNGFCKNGRPHYLRFIHCDSNIKYTTYGKIYETNLIKVMLHMTEHKISNKFAGLSILKDKNIDISINKDLDVLIEATFSKVNSSLFKECVVSFNTLKEIIFSNIMKKIMTNNNKIQ